MYPSRWILGSILAPEEWSGTVEWAAQGGAGVTIRGGVNAALSEIVQWCGGDGLMAG